MQIYGNIDFSFLSLKSTVFLVSFYHPHSLLTFHLLYYIIYICFLFVFVTSYLFDNSPTSEQNRATVCAYVRACVYVLVRVVHTFAQD